MSARIFNKGIPISKCPICNDTGLLKNEFDIIIRENGVDKKCSCVLEKKYINSNIGSSYWNIEPENWDGEEEDLERVQTQFSKLDYFAKTGNGLYLYGPYGTGKSTLAILLLKHVLRTTSYNALFVFFSDLVILNSKIIHGFHDSEALEAIEHIKNVDFLVLDDLAKEFDSDKDNGRATLNSILRYRDFWNKPTFYTSNIPRDGIESKYGASNASVILGRTRLIQMKGRQDYRMIKQTHDELNYKEKAIV